jgi:hypothetical protein
LFSGSKQKRKGGKHMERIVNLESYEGADARARLAAALEDARQSPGTTLIIPAGEYIISTPLAQKTRDDVISGRHGENPEDDLFSPDFAFDAGLSLAGHDGTTVRAYGATLMIDGFMEPVCLKNCRNIRIEGLTIDHVRKPYSRGTIERYQVEDEEERTGYIVVRFADAFPVDEKTIMPRYCAYDAQTGRFNLDMRVQKREYLGDQRVRFTMHRMPQRDLQGQEFYVWHSFHYRPGILIEEAKNITLKDVTIHSQPGMGIVGHRSENILLDALAVVPSAGEHLSTNTDATHFTSCKGELTFTRCRFEGHGDDATNVHTFYHELEALDARTYRGSVSVRTHSLTLDHPDVGDEMELVEKDSLQVRDRFRIAALSVAADGRSYTATLDHDLPGDAAESCYMSDVTRLPFLTFRDCTASNHWARSVLIKTRGALVEGCTFTGSALVAVHIAAEGWWHEGVACADVTVRGNRFVDCGVSGHADVGGVKVEMAVDRRAGTPQRNIVIEGNTFELEGVRHAVHVSNAERVRITGNRFKTLEEPVEIVDCTDVVCEGMEANRQAAGGVIGKAF